MIDTFCVNRALLEQLITVMINLYYKMERYIELDIETIRFEAEDVIVTSNDNIIPGGNGNGDTGSGGIGV